MGKRNQPPPTNKKSNNKKVVMQHVQKQSKRLQTMGRVGNIGSTGYTRTRQTARPQTSKAPKHHKLRSQPARVDSEDEEKFDDDQNIEVPYVPENGDALAAEPDIVQVETVQAPIPIVEISDEEEPPAVEHQVELWKITDFGQRQLAILNHGYKSDVTIYVGYMPIKCHSDIVSPVSPKLAALLKQKNRRLTDINPCHFQLLLQFIYGGRTSEPQNVDVLLQVGQMALKLEVQSAAMSCVQSLADKVDAEWFWQILKFADMAQAPQLIETCLKMVPDEAGCHIKTQGFANFSVSTIEYILSFETIYNVKELDLFLACAEWVNDMPCRREAIQPALRLIRFLRFSFKDFAEHVSPTKLLSPETENCIFRSMATHKNYLPQGFTDSKNTRDLKRMIELWMPMDFPTVKRFEEFPPNSKTSFEMEIIQDVFIYSVIIQGYHFGSNSNDLYDENVVVTLRDTTANKLLCRASFHGQKPLGFKIFVEFDRPILLRHSRQYSMNIAYGMNGDRDLGYILYSPRILKHVRVMNEFVAPIKLKLLIAEKITNADPNYSTLLKWR